MVADPLVASQVLSAGPRYLPRKCSEYAAIDPVSVCYAVVLWVVMAVLWVAGAA
jgi:hypothetical protein